MPAVYGQIDWATLPQLPVADGRQPVRAVVDEPNQQPSPRGGHRVRLPHPSPQVRLPGRQHLCALLRRDDRLDRLLGRRHGRVDRQRDPASPRWLPTRPPRRTSRRRSTRSALARRSAGRLLFVHTNNHGSIDRPVHRQAVGCRRREMVDDARRDRSVRHARRDDGAVLLGGVPAADSRPQPGGPDPDAADAAPTRWSAATPAISTSRPRTWFEAVNTATAYGAASTLQDLDPNADGRVSVREAFDCPDHLYEYPNNSNNPQYRRYAAPDCGS